MPHGHTAAVVGNVTPMGLTYSSVIDAPRDEVFAWHTRPGAFARLSPPWSPMRLISEADSLKDGRAVLGLPGGLRWVAQHQADSYDPPSRFVDVLSSDGLASLPPRIIGHWRHTHDFEEAGPDRTRVIDRLDTPVPERALRQMFVYRHRQLADDLAAHRRAAQHGLAPSTVAVTGASGLVGTALTAFLSTGGHRVIRLVRGTPSGPDERQWNTDDPDPDLLAGVDAVIHLAGASIAGRFTDKHRKAIRDSRIGPTRRLAELVARTGTPVLISASAIGFYGYDRGDDTLTEDSERGDGFLADVVADWEAATAAAEQAGARVVMVRTGIVQSPAGGTLQLMRPLFSAGLGGGSATAASGSPGSGSTTSSTSTIARGGTTSSPERSMPLRHNPFGTPSTPAPSRTCCTGPPCCRYRRWDRGSCSAPRGRKNSRWRTSGSPLPG